MIKNQLIDIESQLRSIANMLLLNGTLENCPGLINGQTGVSMFFFLYARHTENQLFEDYAFDLIEQIKKKIHINSLADYETGIAGIGVGIDYFIKNEFLEVDDDFFDDFDKRMYRAVMYDPWLDFSLYDGLTGYGRYWISRLHQQPSSMQAKECISYITDKIKNKFPDISEKEMIDIYCFLHDLKNINEYDISIEFLEKCLKQLKNYSHCSLRFDNTTIGRFIRDYQNNHYFGCVLQDEKDTILSQIQVLDLEKPLESVGLLGGYAGEGMIRLTALNPENQSWMLLL